MVKVILVNLNPKTGFSWLKTIEKSQSSKFGEILSVWEFYSGDEIHILYNDRKKKEVVRGKLDAEGQWTQSIFGNLEKKGNLQSYYLVPESLKFIDENTLIGYGHRYDKTRVDVWYRATKISYKYKIGL